MIWYDLVEATITGKSKLVSLVGAGHLWNCSRFIAQWIRADHREYAMMAAADGFEQLQRCHPMSLANGTYVNRNGCR